MLAFQPAAGQMFVKKLLKDCADPAWATAEDEDAFTILCHACKNGLHMCIDLIVDKAHDKGILNRGVLRPLWLAASGGHTKVLQQLAKHKDSIDISAAVAVDGTSPLLMAALAVDYETIQALEPFYARDQVMDIAMPKNCRGESEPFSGGQSSGRARDRDPHEFAGEPRLFVARIQEHVGPGWIQVTCSLLGST